MSKSINDSICNGTLLYRIKLRYKQDYRVCYAEDDIRKEGVARDFTETSVIYAVQGDPFTNVHDKMTLIELLKQLFSAHHKYYFEEDNEVTIIEVEDLGKLSRFISL